MVVIIEKQYSKKKIDSLINELTPSKIFDPQKFAGKIKWDEDLVTYQKRIRNEWS